jgi:hypothetical protein
MGVPSAALIQNVSDRLAALIGKDLAGFESELSGATNLSLFDQLDASGDPQVESALLPYALAVDLHSLPEKYPSALAAITSRGALRDFVAQLAGQVNTGGGYSSLRAYLAAVGATVHPLFAELVRAGFGETAFTDSDGLVSTVFAPNYQTRFPDRVFVGADGSLAEETTDATDVGTADVTLFAANGDALYVGSRYKFSHLICALSTLASADVTLTIQYWNGNAWTTLTATDNTTGFRRNDLLTWTPPADWGRTYKDGGGNVFPGEKTPLYYVRLVRGNAGAITAPIGTTIRIVPAVVPTVLGGSTHLGVDQGPLALLRITGTNTLAVEVLRAIEYSRFKPPALRARALTPITGNVTLTVDYVDQGGNNDQKAQSAWAGALAALDTTALSLNTGDTGVRSIRSSTSSVHTATEGVIELYAAELRTPAL